MHAALSTGRGHTVRFPVDALAEGAVIFPPPVSVGTYLTISIAAGRIIKRVHWVFTHRAALPFRHIVPLAVQLATLGGEANGNTALTSTEPAVVHSEHVSIVVFYVIKHTGWLGFINTFKDITALSRCPISTRDYAGSGSHLTHGETT